MYIFSSSQHNEFLPNQDHPRHVNCQKFPSSYYESRLDPTNHTIDRLLDCIDQILKIKDSYIHHTFLIKLSWSLHILKIPISHLNISLFGSSAVLLSTSREAPSSTGRHAFINAARGEPFRCCLFILQKYFNISNQYFIRIQQIFHK